MRQVVSWIIKDGDGKILVVDKPKNNGRILTILPGWKPEKWEFFIEALKREIHEELWIPSQVNCLLWQIKWISPSSQIPTQIHFYDTTISPDANIKTTAEVENPRFMTPEEILKLESSTDLLKQVVRALIEKNCIV